MGAELTCRENEAKFIEKLKDDIARGTTWERITDLIGLENSRESQAGELETNCLLLAAQSML